MPYLPFLLLAPFTFTLPSTMTATASNPSIFPPSLASSTTRSQSPPSSKSTLRACCSLLSNHSPSKLSSSASKAATSAAIVTVEKESNFVSRFAPDEPRKGCDVLIEALEREGVTIVFGYPGGASMDIHQALTRSAVIRNVLPRHEQGGVFAAEGYARASGKTGVCIATSGPGATNLASGLADALLDSIPIVAITGQVPRRMIGTDAFQETPIVEVTRSITKHNYLVLRVKDIPRIVAEAFFLARTGRPGPVLIDIPKDIQQQMVIPVWDQPIRVPGYMARLPKMPNQGLLEQIVRLISESKKPVLYVGGGCLNSSEELRKFVELTGIPVASTLMGLGSYPCSADLSLQMLGMHGTVYANYAVDKADLLLAFGVRFDDRATGKLEAFASRAKIVHIDIDSAEIGKNKQPHVSVCGDIKPALAGMNRILEEKEKEKSSQLKLDFSAWIEELNEQKRKHPLGFKTFGDAIAIPPQYAIQVLDELTNGKAIISTGAGQHQMWAAQFYKYNTPRQWLTSGGLGAMGFGLPAAIGAAAAVARPGEIVVAIDGDESFLMNIQELATVRAENLPVKILLLNNQHLGTVAQWEDRFYKANRAQAEEIFPDMLKFAEACDIPAARVTKKADLRAAIQKMLDTPGPYLLDVIVCCP
ncbi:Agglutinin-like protein 1 precursor [Dionaea muscipula]